MKDTEKIYGAVVDHFSLQVSKYYFKVNEWSYWDKDPKDMIEYFKSVFDEVPGDERDV